MNAITDRKPGALTQYHPLRETLTAAADAIIFERRQKEGWKHYADDLIAEFAEARKVEFRHGVIAGSAAVFLASALAGLVIGWLT